MYYLPSFVRSNKAWFSVCILTFRNSDVFNSTKTNGMTLHTLPVSWISFFSFVVAPSTGNLPSTYRRDKFSVNKNLFV